MFHSFLHNLHRLCPEEREGIGKDIIQLADGTMKLMTSTFETTMSRIESTMNDLRLQSSGKSIVSRLSTPTPLYPGYESLWENRKALAPLRQWRSTVTDLCRAIGYTDTEVITVYNVQVCPREWVMDMMYKRIRAALRAVAFDQDKLNPPKLILNRFADVLYAYQSVERQLSFHLGHIVRDCLLAEFGVENEDIEAATDQSEPRPLIHLIAQWYHGVFSRDLDAVGVIYSPLRRCFISRRSHQANGVAEFERFTDVNNLTALVTLIGPQGTRIMHAAMMKIVSLKMKTVKEVLQAHTAVIKQYQSRIGDAAAFLDAVAQCAPAALEALLSAATSIGCVLQFRTLMSAALSDVMHQRRPHIQTTLDIAIALIHTLAKSDGRYVPVDVFAADCGIDIDENDHLLRVTIGARVKATANDSALFALLPDLFGLSLTAARFRNAVHLIEFGGADNNVHLVPLAVRQIIVAVNRSPPVDASVEARIQSDCERFVRSAAQTLIHCYNTTNNAFVSPANASAPNNNPAANIPPLTVDGYSVMMNVIESFVAMCAQRIPMSALEQALPFAVIRQSYIAIFEKQSANAATQLNFNQQQVDADDKD